MKRASLLYTPWLLAVIVSALAIGTWGHSFGWRLGAINSYQFFPVLGLVAFSLMWTHYVIGALKNNLFEGIDLAKYFRYTGYIVLIAILLHPGILIYQRFRDGYGLPPHSYESYVAPGMGWITMLGTVSLLAFLAFELHRFYARKPWWKYILIASDVAMVAIFYHSLRLGSQLQGGWFRIVWWFYGLSLIGLLIRKYALKLLR